MLAREADTELMFSKQKRESVCELQEESSTSSKQIIVLFVCSLCSFAYLEEMFFLVLMSKRETDVLKPF